MGLAQGTLSSRGRDGVQRGLVVGDALFDLRDESRRVALHDLADARPKLVEKIYSGVATNRRTEVAERSRSGSRPIRTVSSSVSSDRSQYPQEIRSVYSSFSRLVTRDKNARSSVAGSAHKTATSRGVVTRRIQVLIKKGAGPFWSQHRFTGSGKAGQQDLACARLPMFITRHAEGQLKNEHT
jgi:hypothetical protein